MADKLDDLLRALPEPAAGHRLDQLEPLVWRRIERVRGGGDIKALGMRLQLAAAAASLCVGLALGWSQAGAPRLRSETPLLLTHSELALATGLGEVR